MAASDLCRYRRDVQPLVPRSHRRSVYRGCRGGHGGDERAAGQPVLHEGGGGLGTDRGGGGGVGRRRMNASHLIMHVFLTKNQHKGEKSQLIWLQCLQCSSFFVIGQCLLFSQTDKFSDLCFSQNIIYPCLALTGECMYSDKIPGSSNVFYARMEKHK